jgi:hypothetical protein
VLLLLPFQAWSSIFAPDVSRAVPVSLRTSLSAHTPRSIQGSMCLGSHRHPFLSMPVPVL